MAFQDFVNSAWKGLTGYSKNTTATETAIVHVLDMVLRSAAATAAFDTVMLSNNALTVARNNHGDGYFVDGVGNVQALYNMISSADSSVLGAHIIQDWEKTLAEPNVAGVPISVERIETGREIDISESMVIVQESAQKKYWTDNAVPRLKEWSLEGYLTSTSALDTGCIIKPSLSWQIYYLDVCAKSRRPVLFKTNRGEFVKVQITNLRTDEGATYNNAIKVSISLKEYNPYTISADIQDIGIAVLVGGR